MHEPLGVVGVITPFNAPITLAFDPAIDAIGAGNSVMMRFPEATPRTGALMARLVAQYFDPSELAVVTGDLEVARFFAALAFVNSIAQLHRADLAFSTEPVTGSGLVVTLRF